MTEMDFALEDIGDPMLFTVKVTRHRLAGMQTQLDLLLLLLLLLERTCRATEAGARPLGKARRAVGNARRGLGGAGDDVERAMRGRGRPDLFGGDSEGRPIEFALEEEGDRMKSTLKVTRERIAGVHAQLDLLLVLLLVLGRICQNADGRPLGRAKRAVAIARRHLVDARAQLERVFTGERGPGGAELGRQTS